MREKSDSAAAPQADRSRMSWLLVSLARPLQASVWVAEHYRRPEMGRDLRRIDQALSAITNYVPLLAAMAWMRPADSSVMFLLMGLYFVVGTGLRSGLGDALFTQHARAGLPRGVVLVGLAIWAGLAVPAIFVAGRQAQLPLSAVLTFSFWVLAALLQESVRLALIGNGNIESAILSDGVWALVCVGAIVGLATRNEFSVSTLFNAWGVGAVCGLAVGLARACAAGWRPSGRSRDPLFRNAALFALPALLGAVSTHAVNSLLFALGHGSWVGVVRGLQIAFIPVAFIANSQQLTRLQMISRRGVKGSHHSIPRDLFRLRAVLICGLLVALWPLGGTTHPLTAVLLGLEAAMSYAAWQMGLRLRARKSFRALTVSRVLSIVVVLGLSYLAGRLDSVDGLTLALAASAGASFLFQYGFARRDARQLLGGWKP